MNTLEILAPAGSMEALVAAIRCGANAVYLGGKDFSARQNAANFDNDELKEAVNLAHKCGVKIYQTINTLAFDKQRSELEKALYYSGEIGVDALIVQDLGTSCLIRKLFPDFPLHASTQMSIHSKHGAQFARENGFSRVVLAREMSDAQLSEVTSLGIETEVFVHGALCMSVSGQCYMSALIGSRSANRGLCAQACRLPFSAEQGKERYDLSLKDLSIIPHIQRLMEIGVTSLKIEGRMKRPEYVAAAVTACKAAIKGEQPDMDTLKAVFSRSGFTDGYFTSKKGSEMFGVRNRDNVVSANDVLPSLAQLYRKEAKLVDVSVDFTLESEKPSSLTMTDSNGNSVCAFGDVPQLAINHPTDFEQAKSKLSKLGDTIYELTDFSAKIDDGLMLPVSSLNELRRQATDKLDQLRTQRNTTVKQPVNESVEPLERDVPKSPKLRVSVTSASQLQGLDTTKLEYVIIPIAEVDKLSDYSNKDKTILSLPRYTSNEKLLLDRINLAISQGFPRFECTNYAHISALKKLNETHENIQVFGGFGLNATNSLALSALAENGVCDATLSFELTLEQIAAIKSPIPIGVICHGHLPVMLTVNCPLKQAIGCQNCKHSLYDRTGRVFPVYCTDDYAEILNSDVLYMADRLREIKNVDFYTLRFQDESSQQISEIISAYKKGIKPEGKFTRGLYYRGVL